MENKLRIKRLTELEYMLLNHKKLFKGQGITFDLSSWATKICDLATAKLFCKTEGKKVKEETMCGSAACALGSAAIYEPFMKQGLTMVGNGIEAEENNDACVPQFDYTANFVPRYKGWREVEAGEYFFGIEHDEAQYLFMPNRYEEDAPTAKDVAVRVRELIGKYTSSVTP